MIRRQRGVITIYLTMIFLIVVSIIFTTAESARIQAVRMLMETSMDTALESLMARYNWEAYDQFGLFFFDGAFGGTSFGKDVISGKIEEIMDYSLHPEQGTWLDNTNFYQVEIADIALDRVALATDDGGMVFRNQAIEHVKSSIGVSKIEELTGKYNWAMNNIKESENYSAKEQEVENSLVTLEEDKKAVDEEKTEEAANAGGQKNPADDVQALRSMGILELVYRDTSKVSQKSVDITQLPSHRKINRGTGLEQYEEGVLSNILFQCYLMRKFSHAASGNQGSGNMLQYQLEYLLIGKEHDVDNLKGVIHRLLLLREGANFAYLLTDAEKVAEAYTAAMLLVGYTCLPPLIEATKYAILLAWAYAESVLDVRVLLAGEKVALAKSAANWKTSLANMGELVSMDEKQMGDSSGITYAEYLQMMMLIANQEELAMRAVDLVELQLQNTGKNDSIKMDCFISMLEASIKCQTDSVFLSIPFMSAYQGASGRQMKITRRYGYDMW